MWWRKPVDYGLSDKQTAAILNISDEEWHRVMWLEMWRLIGLEHAARCSSRPMSSEHRGHQISQDRDVWRYKSDGATVYQNRRACGECHKPDTIDGHDACLGTLPGVMNACCGHGNQEEAYIQWPDGSCIRGFDAALEQQRLVDVANHLAFMVWFNGISESGILMMLNDQEALRQEWLLMWRLIGQEVIRDKESP